MRVSDYKELRVYRLAFESAMKIFELSRKWPAEEKYSLTDQIRRSSRSVCTNLAEAWRKRRYEAAFVSKLSDSDGEAAETEVHLDFALRCGYLPPDSHAELIDHYDHICAPVRARMMNDADVPGVGLAASCARFPPEVCRGSGRAWDARRNAPNAPRSTRSERSHAPTLHTLHTHARRASLTSR